MASAVLLAHISNDLTINYIVEINSIETHAVYLKVHLHALVVNRNNC